MPKGKEKPGGFGRTPRVPRTGLLILGLLTFWSYTAFHFARLIRQHAQSRWQEIGAPLVKDMPPETVERLRRRCFGDRTGMAHVAAMMYALCGLIVVGWWIHWGWGGSVPSYVVVMTVTSVAAILFYGATLILMLWVRHRIHAHEVCEFALREHGAGIPDGERLAPDAAMVERWEAINNHVALFLIVALAITASPVVIADLFFQGRTVQYLGLPSFVMLSLGGAFHYWGIKLLSHMYDGHLAFERAQLESPASAISVAPRSPENSSAVDLPARRQVHMASPPAAPHYFFSYARVDSEFVLMLAKDLRKAGVPLWLDQLDIVGGQRWDHAIENALASCVGLILVLSPESVASVNVMDEVSYALEERKSVVPVIIKPCDVPFRLRRVQRVDLSNDYASGIAQLLRALNVQPGSQSADLHPVQDLVEANEQPVENEKRQSPDFVFLDFDGVLRPLGSKPYVFDLECLHHFESLMRDHPSTKIVVTSSWRLGMTKAELTRQFSPDIRARIVGGTPEGDSDEPRGPSRHDEILLYLKKNGIADASWIAIDDNLDHYRPGCKSLLVIDSKTGFDGGSAKRFKALLGPA